MNERWRTMRVTLPWLYEQLSKALGRLAATLVATSEGEEYCSAWNSMYNVFG